MLLFLPSSPPAHPSYIANRPAVTCSRLTAALLLFFSLFSPTTLARQESPIDVQISEFHYADDNYIRLALEKVNALTQRHYGTALSHSPDRDIPLLQRLLDDAIVRHADLAELQAMGVALGEVFKQVKYMEWIRYLDQYGVSRALRLKHTDYVIFPVTLISRRASTGIDVDIARVYQQVLDNLNDSQRPEE